MKISFSKLSAFLLIGFLLSLWSCEKETSFSDSENAVLKHIEQQNGSSTMASFTALVNDNPNLQYVYNQIAPIFDSEYAEAFSEKVGTPQWDRAIISRKPYLLVGDGQYKELTNAEPSPVLLPQTVIVPFVGKSGSVDVILISEFEPNQGELRQKFIERTFHKIMLQAKPDDYLFARAASYAFTYFDNHNGTFGEEASFGGICPSECGCILLPHTGLCGLEEDQISGPHLQDHEREWYVSVPCPCTPSGPGNTGGTGGSDPGGSSGPVVIENGSGTTTVIVDGITHVLPDWYTRSFLTHYEWIHRRPIWGGSISTLYTQTAFFSILDRLFREDEYGQGGGGLPPVITTEALDDCIEAAFPPHNQDTGGGVGQTSSHSQPNFLLGLLTDMFAHDGEMNILLLRLNNTVPLTLEQARFLILHGDSELKPLVTAVENGSIPPALASLYLEFKTTYDPCNNQFPWMDFEMFRDDQQSFFSFLTYIRQSPPADQETTENAHRAAFVQNCLGVASHLLTHLLEDSEMLAYYFDELSNGGCNDQNFKKAAVTALAADQLGIACDLDHYLNHTLWASSGVPEDLSGGFSGWVDAPESQEQKEMIQDLMVHLNLVNPNRPCWFIRMRAEYIIYSQGLHTMFDVCGMVEAMGAVCDLANGVFYAIEGNGTEAAMSLAAALPGGVVINSSRILKLAKRYGTSPITRRFVWREVNGLVAFSHAGSYKKVWQEVYPALHSTANIAHHVIPQSLALHPLVQRAARANPNQLPDGTNPFHMNMPDNGWPVPSNRHMGNHQTYSDRIEARMDEWLNDNQNATREQAASVLAQWQQSLKALIDNSTANINNLPVPSIP